MGIFNDYTREGRGVDKGIDTRPRIVVFFDIFSRKFWNLIKINLLFVLTCIPIVTIGPAIAGMTKILRNYAREEHAFIWSDFWKTFKNNFVKALFIGLFDVFAAFVIYFDFSSYLTLQSSMVIRVISLAVIMISGTIILFMNYYIFSMLITFNLTFKQLVKNAFLFAWIGFWRNLVITLIIGGLTVFALMYIVTFGSVYIILLHFSLCGLIINFTTYPLIRKHMIDGYDPNTGLPLDIQKEQED